MKQHFDLKRDPDLKQHLVWLFWLLLSAGIIFGSRKVAMSYYFPDETDHVAVGYFLLKDRLQLYQDVTSIHQPIQILIGAPLSSVLDRSTLFAFISQLRFALSMLWFVGGSLLIYRFGWRGLGAALGTGLLSYAYFGWYLLGESLVITPVAIMVLLLLEQLFGQKKRPTWWSDRLDWVLFGFFAFFLVFNLLPTAPFVGIAGLLYWVSHKQKLRVFWHLLGGFLIPTILLFLLVNPIAWWDQTILNLINYWFPVTPGLVDGAIWDLLLWPFASAVHSGFNPSWAIMSVLILTPIAYFSVLKRWNTVAKLVLAYGVVSLLNLRTAEPGATFWQGFHTYPYLAGLFAWVAGSWSVLLSTKTSEVPHTKTSKRSRQILVTTGILLTLAYTYFAGSWLWAPSQRQQNYEILYLPQQSIINVLKILKTDGDTLWTGPDGHGYLNVLTDLPFGDKQNFHLPWSFYSPYLRQDFYDTFANNPPTFVYFQPFADADPYYEAVQEQLDTQYLELPSPGGNPSQLWILRQVAEQIPIETWTKYEETLWLVPEELRQN